MLQANQNVFLGLEDKATACQMLVCYARELKEHFVEYAEQTVRLMVPMLKFYFHDGVRAAAAESLPYLLECAKIRGPQYVQEMWAHICPELLKVFKCCILTHLTFISMLIVSNEA